MADVRTGPVHYVNPTSTTVRDEDWEDSFNMFGVIVELIYLFSFHCKKEGLLGPIIHWFGFGSRSSQ